MHDNIITKENINEKTQIQNNKHHLSDRSACNNNINNHLELI